MAPVLFNSHVGCLPDRYRYRNTPILLDTRVVVVAVVVGNDEKVIVTMIRQAYSTGVAIRSEFVPLFLLTFFSPSFFFFFHFRTNK